MESKPARDSRSSALTGFLIALLLAALPVAVWLDLTNLADAALRRQATDLNSVVSSVRSYYASNVVGRILAHPGGDPGDPQLRDRTGRHPDSGDVVAWNSARSSANSSRISAIASFRIFRSRTAPRTSSTISRRLRCKACAPIPTRSWSTLRSSLFSDQVRLVAPVIMGPACVSLSQRPSGKPQARLESRRRPRHSGSRDHPADRRQYFLVQVPAGLFRAGSDQRGVRFW